MSAGSLAEPGVPGWRPVRASSLAVRVHPPWGPWNCTWVLSETET